MHRNILVLTWIIELYFHTNYDNLVRFGRGAELLPGLAKKWEISPDGLKYTFQLRDSVLFQDGKNFECIDIKKSFERILHPKTNSHRKWLFKKVSGSSEFSSGSVESVTGFRCEDENNFLIEFVVAGGRFLSCSNI